MAARAYWKGYLKLSLVTIAVELYSAVSSTRTVEMHQIHKPSGKRIRYQKVAPGIGPVENDEIVKGYETEKDNYVIIEPEELDAIKLESKRTIEFVQFVDDGEIDARYFDTPYYVVPAEAAVAEEGFAVIREALRGSKKIGLGQMAVRGRDYIVAVKPFEEGLLLETLRYSDEVKAADKIFADIPDVAVDKDMLSLAEELIERKTKPFDPEMFKSQYTKALRALIEEKRKTGHVSAVSEEELGAGRSNVIDLMEALKKSVAKDKGGARAAPATAGRTKTASKKKATTKRKTAKRAAG